MDKPLKNIELNGDNLVIMPDADKVQYSNQTMTGITNTKGALDNIQQRLRTVEQVGTGIVAPRYQNHPLPYHKSDVKILSISNSLTIFPLFEMANLLNAVGGITTSDLKLELVHSPGRTMSEWLTKLRQNSADNQHWYWYINNNNEWKATYNSAALQTLVSGTEWDVIVLQEYPATGNSENAGSYVSFKDTLYEMVRELRSVCPNPKVAIAWTMIYPQATPNTPRATYMNVWGNVAEATKQLVVGGGIDIVVPMGTAYANAVNTATFNGANTAWLLRDGTHPGMGVSAYIGSCTFYETLIAPILGKSMYPVTTVYPMYNYGQAAVYPQAEIAVSADNIGLCHDIVMSAICDMYNVDYGIDPIQ